MPNRNLQKLGKLNFNQQTDIILSKQEYKASLTKSQKGLDHKLSGMLN
jgi:hypothetical protein